MTAAIVVTYHPETEIVCENIRSYLHAVDKVLVWRNSPEEFDIPPEMAEKILLMGKGENEYMAKPLNAALDWCRQHGYDYLLTMDHDSKWENAGHFMERALSMAEEDVAIYAPYIVGQYARPEQDYDAESVITSGSLVNVRIATRLGGFREDYQIYWVDGEFCYWTRKNGYRIRVLHDCALIQQFGRQTRTLFGFTTQLFAVHLLPFDPEHVMDETGVSRGRQSQNRIIYPDVHHSGHSPGGERKDPETPPHQQGNCPRGICSL